MSGAAQLTGSLLSLLTALLLALGMNIQRYSLTPSSLEDDGRIEVYHTGEYFQGNLPILSPIVKLVFKIHAQWVAWATEHHINHHAFVSDSEEEEEIEHRSRVDMPLHLLKDHAWVDIKHWLGLGPKRSEDKKQRKAEDGEEEEEEEEGRELSQHDHHHDGCSPTPSALALPSELTPECQQSQSLVKLEQHDLTYTLSLTAVTLSLRYLTVHFGMA